MKNQDVVSSEARQYLTFMLAGEEYALDILKVQEIKGFTTITPLPNTPAYIKGVMNLRGTVVPVVDLRSRLCLPTADYDKFTVIIIASVSSRVVGMVVDAVSDVLDIGSDTREAPPDLGVSVDTSYMEGMAKVGERLITLLHLEKTVGSEAA